MTPFVRLIVSKEHYLKVISDNATRWDGKYLSLNRFLELKDVFLESKLLMKHFKVKLDKKSGMPDDVLAASFFRRLSCYHEVLEKVYEVTKACQSRTASASAIPSFIWTLQEACASDGSIFAKKLLGAINEKLDKEYLGDDSLPLQAALLDPRYSQRVREKYGKDDVALHWNVIVRKAIDIDQTALHGGADAEALRDFKLNTLKSATAILQNDMDKWLAEKVEKAQDIDRLDPLKYWTQPAGFPVCEFRKVAAYFLSTIATSAESERGFSGTGGALTDERNCMSDAFLEKLTVTRCYLRSPEYDFRHIMGSLKQRVEGAEMSEQREGKRPMKQSRLDPTTVKRGDPAPEKGKEEEND